MDFDRRRGFVNRSNKEIGKFEDAPPNFMINLRHSKIHESADCKLNKVENGIQGNGHKELPQNFVLPQLSVLS
jgi:hypothetical protein